MANTSRAADLPDRSPAIGRFRRACPIGFAAVAACAALLIAGSSITAVPVAAASGTQAVARPASGLGALPIDQDSLQAAVEAATTEMMVPGAVVLVRGPQGTY